MIYSTKCEICNSIAIKDTTEEGQSKNYYFCTKGPHAQIDNTKQ